MFPLNRFSNGIFKHLSPTTKLFFTSLVVFYFEMVVVRYLPTEVRTFANLKNLPLVACFFGMGLGMLRGRPTGWIRNLFPLATALLFLLIHFALVLGLTYGDQSWEYNVGASTVASVRTMEVARFMGVGLGFSMLIVLCFVALGGFVGEHLQQIEGIKGYGVNLAGSLAGLLLFGLISCFNLGPLVWLMLGFGLLICLVCADRFVILACLLVLAGFSVPQHNTFWSPYYRIDLQPFPVSTGRVQPDAYSLVCNHNWYQYLADLTPQFLEKNPNSKPNAKIAPYYELPYRLVPHPQSVLVLGAGTGNDVAAALRHGAMHVDAVEIDPLILKIGKTYHPEHPYNSARVETHITDARAFLRRTTRKYDLIVFAFLDSTSLVSSFSSLRLDNYVYTVESFTDAKAVLADGGTLVLSFALSRSFATERLYATVKRAFGIPPAAYSTEYWVSGVFLVEGYGREQLLASDSHLANISDDLERSTSKDTLSATDDWPFLYLTGHSIPPSVLVTACIFILSAWVVMKNAGCSNWVGNPKQLHFFFLGAGFLLLETKAITQMSLLFGNTWIVILIVVGSFLVMAFVSNALAGRYRMPPVLAYFLLIIILTGDFWFPYRAVNSLGILPKILAAGLWAALPVFFSGIIFSSGIKNSMDSASVLGVNLFGCVCGGLLENVVMIGGNHILKVFVLVLYGASAVFLYFIPSGPGAPS